MSKHGLKHQAIEDYTKTIYQLSQIEIPVSTSRIAEMRQVKPASVTNMLQKLAKLELVDYEKHYGATLTKLGEKMALKMIRHHRLIELFLIQALGFTWDEVHEEAELLEHVLSEKLENRIAAVLGYPEFDPHGSPIPSKDGIIKTTESLPLTSLKKGEKAEIMQIRDDTDSELLCYLTDIGIAPGKKLLIIDVAPFEGPITITMEGNHNQIIGQKIAHMIAVVPISDEIII